MPPHSINDYKVALVRLGAKLPTGQRSKAEYQQLYDEVVQQRQQGKRKEPMTPTEPAAERQTKQAKKATSQPPRPPLLPRATRPRAEAPAQQPTPPAQPQASSSAVGRPAAQRPAPASLPRPAAVPPRQPAPPPRQLAPPPRRPAAAWCGCPCTARLPPLKTFCHRCLQRRGCVLRGVWRDVSTSHAGGVGGARPARVGGGARLRPAQRGGCLARSSVAGGRRAARSAPLGGGACRIRPDTDHRAGARAGVAPVATVRARQATAAVRAR